MPIQADIDRLLRDFDKLPWTDCWTGPELVGAYLYILVAVNAGQRFPIYVGQTRRFRRRMGDYCGKSFYAATDFKVGEAIPIFERAGFKIEVFYKLTSNALLDEKRLIREVQFSGNHIFNELSGYSYTQREEHAERENVQRFAQMMIREASSARLH